MADYVATKRYVDELGAAADAAGRSFERAGNEVDAFEKATTRVGSSADKLIQRYVAGAREAANYEAALRKLKQYQETMDTAVAQGTATLDQRNQVVEAQAAKVRAASAALQSSVPVAEKVAASQGQAAFAARQLEVQFTQLVSGIATGQPVFTTLIQQGHQVGDVMMATGTSFRQMGSAVLGMLGPFGTLPGLIGVAAVGALAAFGVEAEVENRRLLSLQTALRATRDDFSNMAAEADRAARAVAASSVFGSGDTRQAAGAIAAAPQFQGSQAQLESLIRTAGDLATVLGETLPESAKKFAAAMADPGKMAGELAQKHFRGMSAALADQIKLQAQAGDTAGAFARVLDVVKAATKGASDDALTPLQKSLTALENAFTSSEAGGRSLSKVLGDSITGAAAVAVDSITLVINAINALRHVAAAVLPTQGGVLPGSQLGSTSNIAITPNTSLPSDISNRIYALAEAGRYGGTPELSGLQADFATRIAAQESHGQQFAPGGGVLTSAAGAQGIMGLMPGTAAGLGVNAADTDQNITGGLRVIAQLWAKYGGNPALVAMAYNWGQGNVDAFLAGSKTLAAVPAETRAYVQTVAGVDVAGIRSGSGLAGANANGAGALSAVGSDGLPLPVPPLTPSADSGVVNRPQDIIDAALGRAKAAGASGFQASTAKADIDAYTAALATLASQGETTGSRVSELAEALGKARTAYREATAPIAKLVDDLAAQAAANDRVADAWSRGALAAQQADSQSKAQAAARELALRGIVLSRDAVAALAAAYDRLAQSEQNRQAQAREFDQGQQLQYLQAESALVGASVDVRNRELAALKERQEIEKTMPGLEAAERDKLVANAEAIADATTQLQRQQDAINEIGNMLTQVADQIGNALTQAFVSGQGSAVNFGNVARGVLASVLQEVTKLAIINPILNSVIGTSRPTLGSAIDALNGSGGGSSGGSLLSTGGNLLSLGSITDKLGLTDFADTLGLNDLFSGVKGILATPIISGAAPVTSAETISALAESQAAGALDAASLGSGAGFAAAGSPISFGSALGGAVGLGFGAPSNSNEIQETAA